MNDRDEMAKAVGGVLFNAMNFPKPAITRLLGQDMRPLNDKITDAVLAAGFSRTPETATVATVDELDALPVDSVLKSGADAILKKVGPSEWYEADGAVDVFYSAGVMECFMMPAQVLYRPVVQEGGE